jgi:flagellar biosynthesis protein FlhG
LADAAVDQAHGLRRMFRGARFRVIHIVAGRAGVGRTTVAANLGMALARNGRATLLLECVSPGAKARTLAELDIASAAAQADGHTDATVATEAHGLAVARVTMPPRSEGGRSGLSRLELDTLLKGGANALDYVLITSTPELAGEMLVADDEQRDVIVVLSKAASSITTAYALIKRMSARVGQRTFYILVNAVGSETEALLIYQNMEAVARGYLDVELQLIGFVPRVGSKSHAEGGAALPPADEFRHRSAVSYSRLAEDIAGWTTTLPEGGPLASPHRATAGVLC